MIEKSATEKPAKPRSVAIKAPDKPEPETREEVQRGLARYVDMFGAENGAQWFVEGLSIAEAQLRENEFLRQENERLQENGGPERIVREPFIR